MLIYDDSFAAVMTATQQEATALGAHVYGSEHVLLGLLTEGGPLTEAVSGLDDTVTHQGVHHAVTTALDDAPLLQALGLETLTTPAADTSRPRPSPRNRHTPELQAALNTASAKWGQLRRAGYLPRTAKMDTTVLWLAVLEPAARASRLLQALGANPDQLRVAVLGASTAPGEPTPPWPAEVRTGPVTRLVHRLFNRTSHSA